MISKKSRRQLNGTAACLAFCILLMGLFSDLGLNGLSTSFQLFSVLSFVALLLLMASANEEAKANEKKQDTTEE